MRAYDVIHQKRLGQALTDADIKAFVEAYVAGVVPDYQMSAFAMAVVFQGMSHAETTSLTLAMQASGQTLDWSDIPGTKVDKHSTGGVGDTTTLVLAPLVASLGVPIAKMSGRGLGHTGGTIDKLESIPGFRAEMSIEHFRHQVQTVGVAVAAQTADLAPADKKLYALRDVTDTVESIPLIASSIMSKKLASGADAIVLDVKVGDGAFMKDVAHARSLARTMVAVGHLAGRQTTAVLTRMDEPLGRAIGNALEVREAISTLRGQGPADLLELCLVLGAEMVVQGGKAKTVAEARERLLEQIENGKALQTFRDFVAAQGGDARVVDDLSLLPKAPVVVTYIAPTNGIVTRLHAEAMGLVAMRLGAGRQAHGDEIDAAVGLVIQRKVGESVVQGEVLVEIHARTEAAAEQAREALADCIELGSGETFEPPLVLEVIRHGGTSAAADGRSLMDAALAIRDRAYVPYSRFPVGAALRFQDGSVITGVNVENASFGLTNCAERGAVFQAIARGVLHADNPVVGIAVAADSVGPIAPCGACRQVLAEFCAGDVDVWLTDVHGQVKQTTVAKLLPYAFNQQQMNDTTRQTEEEKQ